MPRPPKWSPEDRTRALTVLEREGLAAAHHATGIPKPTIHRWAIEAGMYDQPAAADPLTSTNSPPPIPERSGTQRTEAATLERRRRLDLARENRALLLSAAATKALTKTLERLDDPEVPVRDLVGVWTRAEHDLALITGHATENAEVVVTLNVPPATVAPPRIVAEDDLPQLTG